MLSLNLNHRRSRLTNDVSLNEMEGIHFVLQSICCNFIAKLAVLVLILFTFLTQLFNRTGICIKHCFNIRTMKTLEENYAGNLF